MNTNIEEVVEQLKDLKASIGLSEFTKLLGDLIDRTGSNCIIAIVEDKEHKCCMHISIHATLLQVTHLSKSLLQSAMRSITEESNA